MVSWARRRLLGGDDARHGTFHCSTRCVRRAFLCGRDPLTDQDYSYRRDWIMLREEQLAGLFTIDIEFRSEMKRMQAQLQRKNARDRADVWMAELTLQPENTATHSLADTSRTGRRASDMGIPAMSLDSYRRLLDWTAWLIQSGERSTVPKDLAAILDHMNIEQEAWLETVRGYDELFCHVVGSCASLGEAAKRMEASRLKGAAACSNSRAPPPEGAAFYSDVWRKRLVLRVRCCFLQDADGHTSFFLTVTPVSHRRARCW